MVTLHIENTYSDGFQATTTQVAEVPLPMPSEQSDERTEWEWEHIFPHTGTGWSSGDSFYDVEIVQSTAPELIGATFDFGY